MKNMINLSDDISQRIDRLAERTRMTREQIIEDALTHGRSLAWQEKWIAGVQAGIEDADSSNFVTEDEIALVLSRYES